MRIAEDYENNYSSLPFENILQKYRKRNIKKYFSKYPHQNILEIGCGSDPFFNEVSDFTRFVAVEPGSSFYKKTKKQAGSNPKVYTINGFIEDVYADLKDEKFDFIIIGGFIHEISNPEKVLAAVRKLCLDHTIVYNFAPNAKSLHRLLACEMGLIESIYQKSEHDKMFNRQTVFDLDLFNELMKKNEFKTLESGYYESGLIIDNILRVNILNLFYFGLGAGAFYRYGYYSFEKPIDNAAFKASFKVTWN